MKIESGLLTVWTNFSLELNTPLEFIKGGIYHLTGLNGSGKSSFISQILLPRLTSRQDCYLLYLEQQMHLQLQTIKAYARMFGTHKAVNTESEAVSYLLSNLATALQKFPQPCYILMDESRYEAEVLLFAKKYSNIVCLIYTSHNPHQTFGDTVVFEPQNTNLSKVYAGNI